MEQIQDSLKDQVGAAQVVSATTTPAADTSPLSELPETPTLDMGRLSRQGDAERSEAHDDGDDEDSGGEQSSDELPYGCQYCSKKYVSEEKLKRHLRDTRCKCARSRPGTSTSGNFYTCPRCDAQMSKKYSIERHIKDSCWKVCDECCESHHPTCDAYYANGACTHCVQQLLPCTKHTEPVPTSNPELLIGAPTQPYKSAPRSSRASTVVQHDKGKRKAIDSPGASPKSKPVAKRPAAAVVKKETTFGGQTHEADRLRPPYVPRFASDTKLRDRMGLELDVPASGSRVTGHQRSRDYTSIAPSTQRTLMAQHVQRGQGYPVPQFHPSIPRLTPGQQYDGRDAMTPEQALARWPNIRNSAGRMPYIVGRNGEVLNQSAIDGDEMLKGLRVDQTRIEALAARHNNVLRVPAPIYPAIQPQDGRRNEFNDMHPATSRLNRFRPAQSTNFKVYEEAALRRLRPNDFIASAPGSRMPSRQSSPEPTADLRVPTHLPANEQARGTNTMSQTGKGVVARKLTQPIALQRSAFPEADEDDPKMTFRIHSNTYDINGTPIFSILTMRVSQKFGPRLEVYCQQRNKQYGVDWVFIYRYAIGGPDDDARERYIKIDYNMTPSDVRDPERPDIKLRDMDTIMIMKAKSRLAAMIENSRKEVDTPLSPIGSQVSEENIDIIDGETPIYQNAGTIANWNRIVENKMMELRVQAKALTDENQYQKSALARQSKIIGDFVKRNNAAIQNRQARTAGRGTQADPALSQSAANYHRAPQRGPTVQRNVFVDRLESVREPTAQMAPQTRMQQYQFPTYRQPIQGRRPTYDSGEREAFPDFQRNGVPTMQPAQFAAYGMGGTMASRVPVPQHVQGNGRDIDATVAKVEDVDME